MNQSFVKMSVIKNTKYLNFFKSILWWLNLWPQQEASFFNLIKQYFVPGIILITTFPIICDAIVQFQGKDRIIYESFIDCYISLDVYFLIHIHSKICLRNYCYFSFLHGY